jgi:NADPH2:quinone reductase
MEFPRVIPNSDGAGIIDQIGDGVTQLSAGQRVWLFNGQRNGRAFGTAAEYITLADYLVTPLPDDLSFAAGATLGIPCMTAWCSLFGDARSPARPFWSPAAPARSDTMRCNWRSGAAPA